MKEEIDLIQKKLTNYFNNLNRLYELKYDIKKFSFSYTWELIFEIRLQNIEKGVIISELTYIIRFYLNKKNSYKALYLDIRYDKDFYINLKELSKIKYPSLFYIDEIYEKEKQIKINLKPVPHGAYLKIFLNYEKINESTLEEKIPELCIKVNSTFGKEKSFKTRTGFVNYVYRVITTLIDTLEYKDQEDIWGKINDKSIKEINKLKKFFEEEGKDFNEIYKLDVFSSNKKLSKNTLF